MKITKLNPEDCRPHPMLDRMAMEHAVIGYLGAKKKTAEQAERAEQRLGLVASITRHGVREPIRVTQIEDGYLIADGRHRWEAAKEAGAMLPAIIISESQVRTTVITSLAQRRHLSKGCIAWLMVSLHPEIADTVVGKPGARIVLPLGQDDANGHSVSIKRHELAAEAGISRSLLNLACKLWGYTKINPDKKDITDAAIAAGIGLGALVAGLGGDDGLPPDGEGGKARPEPHGAGFLKVVATMGTQFRSFQRWKEEHRSSALADTAKLFAQNPHAKEFFAAAIAIAAAAEPDAASAE